MNLAGLILKIASRCNLNCSYCYMYNKGDMSYLSQPKFMSKKTMVQVVARIEDYCKSNNLSGFLVIFHGGEPLMAHKDLFEFFVRECLKLESVSIDFALQTNGILVDDEWCELFKRLNISVGFSLDGTRESNDAYRVYHSGKGSFLDTLKGIDIYKKHFPNDLSVITVMNIDYDPIEIYEHYKEIGVNMWNILLPDYTHDTLPYWLESKKSTIWADKMVLLFDHWLEDNDDGKPMIDIFITIINLVLARENAGNDHFGTRENNTIVIETDGGIEATDPLRACGDGFTKEGMTIFSNTLEEALQTPLSKLYINSTLCDKCQACPIVEICGGGYVVHRYSKHSGFDNPSIYCSNLIRLITHVYNRLLNLEPSLKEHLSPMEYEDLIERI
ncbi:radical SAM protein [Dyadobacter endophyticus]|nr:radical SAM protein [Dyadobacter endophyticus]